MADAERSRVPRGLDLLAAYSWRLIVVGVVGYALLVLLGKLTVVVFPLYVAGLLTVVLEPIARRLKAAGLPNLAAAWAAFLSFFAILGLAGMLIVPSVADEMGDLGDTITQGIDDIEDWLVDDAPFDVSRQDIRDLRSEAGDALQNILRDNQDEIVSSAVVAFEVIAGVILALIATFFFLKDGKQMQDFFVRSTRPDLRPQLRGVARQVWTTLRGYMVGSATLGLLEGVVLTVTLLVVGADLALPVGVLTFFAAFVPFVGAVTAGVIAVLVTLVTAGAGEAAIVALVALLVQQFDNDLLAPIVFGKALELHPLLILFSITGFSALFGIVGAFVAVPVTASVINGYGAWRQEIRGDEPEPSADPDPA